MEGKSEATINLKKVTARCESQCMLYQLQRIEQATGEQRKTVRRLGGSMIDIIIRNYYWLWIRAYLSKIKIMSNNIRITTLINNFILNI